MRIWLLIAMGCEPVVEDAERRLLGYGETFGECQGFCESEVRFDGVQVAFMAVAPDNGIENTGVLTDNGRQVLQDLVLDGPALEPVYGCPDCDDGGAATVTIGTPDGGFESHRFEAGAPPEVLEDMATFGSEIHGALRDCQATPRVEITGDCTVVED